jgi:HK97 family phage portal protein
MALTDFSFKSFFNNMFGSKEFYRVNVNQILGRKDAVWINTEEPYKIFNEVPQVKAAISRLGAMFSNMEIHLVKDGVKLEDEDFEKLIKKPNASQNMNDWLKNYYEQLTVYGNQFMYKNKPSSLQKYPNALWNISPRYMKPYMTGKIFDQLDMDSIVNYYEYRDSSNTRRFETQDILWSRISDLDNPFVGVSPLANLKFPISNIKAAYEYRNVILTEKGAIGILSNANKDGVGGTIIPEKDRTEIENMYVKGYGVSEGQKRVILTSAALAWQPMTYPTKDLMLFEEIDENTRTILDLLGVNANIFNSKNSTFENVKNGIKQTYQDTIFPAADAFVQSLGTFLELEEDTKIVASYDYLPVFQEDIEKGVMALEQRINTLGLAVSNGFLTQEAAASILETEIDAVFSND